MFEIKLKDIISEIILEGARIIEPNITGWKKNSCTEPKKMEKNISEGIKCPINWFKLHIFKMYILLSLGQNRTWDKDQHKYS